MPMLKHCTALCFASACVRLCVFVCVSYPRAGLQVNTSAHDAVERGEHALTIRVDWQPQPIKCTHTASTLSLSGRMSQCCWQCREAGETVREVESERG